LSISQALRLLNNTAFNKIHQPGKQLIRMRPELLTKMNAPWATPWIKEIAFTYEN